MEGLHNLLSSDTAYKYFINFELESYKTIDREDLFT